MFSDLIPLIFLSATPQNVGIDQDGNTLDYPLITADPSIVCVGTKFYDALGVLTEGTRSCTAEGPSCTTDGGTTCITTIDYPAAALGSSGLNAGNIKTGVTIGGVTGQYPSAAYPLVGTSAPDLTLALFNAQISSSTTFQWFDSAGTPHTHAGDGDIVAANIVNAVPMFGTTGSATIGPLCTSDGQSGCVVVAYDGVANFYKAALLGNVSAWDLRAGKTLAGISGKLDFYKNMADLNNFDRTTGSGALVSVDIYDTIDDDNNDGTRAFPTTDPSSSWNRATGANWVRDPLSDTGVGGGTVVDGSCDGAEDCVYQDNITGLYWAKDIGPILDWEGAITYCFSLNSTSYGGYSAGWRLPTQKEFMQAYIDGISSLWTPLNIPNWTQHWTATSDSRGTNYAWIIVPRSGYVYSLLKTDAYYMAMCVR